MEEGSVKERGKVGIDLKLRGWEGRGREER